MNALLDWIHERTGARMILREALFEHIPGGARWRYVWGSTLTFTFFVQVITGVFLWMAYSPSSQTAWESVYYIQHEMWGGWVLRGIHHYTAQAMTVLLALHLMQVVIDGAYKAPREVNFWSGIALLLMTLGLSLTGYLLPWDQKGYWATKVATNIAAITPLIGSQLQRVIVGGTDYGHHTLTRFFALHAGVLPAMIIGVIAFHVYLFRRHGITAKLPKKKPDAAFWPDQVLKDVVACLAVMVVVMFLVVKFHGADLGAPADPSESYSSARPEWYFLWLFEMLKHFRGGTEVWGAIVLPTVWMLLLAAMPFIGRWKLGHRFNVGYLCVLLFGAATLTGVAMLKDGDDVEFQSAKRQSDADAERAVTLARSPSGIPAEGAVSLLRNDPLTQGPRLFAKHCAGCHRYNGHDGTGDPPTKEFEVRAGDTLASLVQRSGLSAPELTALNPHLAPTLSADDRVLVPEAQTAPDLKGFGSREWLTGFLDPARIGTPHYFGGSKLASGKMTKFVSEKVSKYSPELRASLQQVIAAVSAEAGLRSQRSLEATNGMQLDEGRRLLREVHQCTDCHQFQKPDEDATAPDLTGWGSREWLVAFISNPAHPRFYGKRNDRMPRFKDDGVLNDHSIGLLADWLRGEWYEPTR